MNVSRETIMVALYNLLQACAPFQTTGRREQFWQDIADFPALFLIDGDEQYPPREALGLPPKVTMEAMVVIFADDGKDPETVPGAVINNLLDSVERALRPSPVTGLLNLASPANPQGVVANIWIEGTVEKLRNDAGNIASAVIPLRILVPY